MKTTARYIGRDAMRFAFGQIVATRGVMHEAKDAPPDTLGGLLKRHGSGDWGDLCAEDKAANEAALRHGSRLMSAYTLPNGVKVWVITEADRSVTTILLPDEY